ncbi:MAG TPA: hypothetical protein VFQ05_16055 [Candidatus Eisenbacteria bacterium]|nr:hypothetical protein [Candidatus Eisenbacteria bacterium]
MSPRAGLHAIVARIGRAVPLVLGAWLLAGCFDEPEIEDRWTRVDVVASSVAPFQNFSAGSAESITVRAKITFRRILTGYAVVELRASTIPASAVALHPDAPRVPMAGDIDNILANSVSCGRATRAVTGWDHLIQTVNLGFTGQVPATASGLFLIGYLADGDEIELSNGADSLVITPYASTPYEILPVGMELGIVP